MRPKCLMQCFHGVLIVLVAQAMAVGQQATDSPAVGKGYYWSEEQAAEKLDGFARMHDDAGSWQKRAGMIRQGILEGGGLATLPARCDLQPVRHSLREMDGYTVENLAFQSLPGYWVTANLYRSTKPALNADGKMPGIAAPHGHWEFGRVIAQNQTRCAAMARMGATVLIYDMVGFGENEPVPHNHPQTFRLQTWNSIRALDLLLSLGDVDENRLAVTGCSGGGTQSFVLAAVDDRVDLSIPVCQVSEHFFGGCVCESGMPVHGNDSSETSNVEIAALAAPKPQLIISNGEDWTKNFPRVGWPYVQRVYAHFGAGDRCESAHFADEGHDYGPSKRLAAYRFLAKHFQMDLSTVTDAGGKIDETAITVLDKEELLVFDHAHPRDANSLEQATQVFEVMGR